MTPRLAVQACELVDRLLRSPEEISIDGSGSPVETHDDSLDTCCAAEKTTVSGFEHLVQMISRLTPTTSATPTTPAATIEEISDQQAQLDKEQTLMAKSCQAVALYAADAALLTPWSSHQLNIAARTLLKQLCAAMPGASASSQHNEQDFIAAMVPAILPLLSSALTSDGTHSITQGPSQQEGEPSASLGQVQLTCNVEPSIGPSVHSQHVPDSLMCLVLIV